MVNQNSSRSFFFGSVMGALFLSSGFTLAHDFRSSSLDDKLERLYESVQSQYHANSQFQNSSNPRLYLVENDPNPLPPEFSMPSLAKFKLSLKSYCKLMQSRARSQVKNTSRFTFMDYSESAMVRRFYVYDVKGQRYLHQTWGTHAALTGLYRSYSLGLVMSGRKENVLTVDDMNGSHFFSNRPGSNLSTLGMVIAEPSSYLSQTFPVNALRLIGVDQASLNSNILSRSIVIHSFGNPGRPFDSEHVRSRQYLPSSDGCLMFPKDDFFEGIDHVNVNDQIIADLRGSPILLYHERMSSQDLNQSVFESEKEDYKNMRDTLDQNLDAYANQFAWSPSTLDAYRDRFHQQLKTEVLDLMEETYRYFQNASLYLGVEPEPSACASLLGIE